MTVIGRACDRTFGSDHPEYAWWVGKPWRRLEVTRREVWYRGVRIARTWDVSGHLGIRWLGVGVTVALVRDPALDYTDEQHQ